MTPSNDTLIELVSRYRLTLPGVRAGYDVQHWRACGLAVGSIPSLDLPVRLICTNGTVAWFLRGDDAPFWGHLSNFVSEKKVDRVPAFWAIKTEAKRRANGARDAKRQAILDSI